MEVKKPGREVVYLTRAINLDKNNPNNLIEMALTIGGQNRYEAACSLEKRVVIMDPKNALA